MGQKLRFRARGTALVRHVEKQEARVRAYVGRKFVEVEPGKWGFAPTGKVEEVAYHRDYIKACADGDLHAADEETAALCNEYARAHGLPRVVVTTDPEAGSEPAAPAGKKG